MFWSRSSVFIVGFEQNPNIAVNSIVDLEQVNAGWVNDAFEGK